MASTAEVEVKFLINDIEAITQKMRDAGLHLGTPRKHEMNELFDTPEGTLRSRGELLRIRKYGDAWKLTHKTKGSAGKHKTRVETETSVQDGEALRSIFESLGLIVTFRYEKFRTEWSDGHGHVVLDETPIGNIGEIEGSPEWIDAIAATLGLRESDYITASYAQMFFDWKRRTGSPAEEMTWTALGKIPRH
jgi:adenylate cyclase, class 2